MFWDTFHEESHLEKLLSQHDVDVVAILDEEDVVDECRLGNQKLLDLFVLTNAFKFCSQKHVLTLFSSSSRVRLFFGVQP
jgi:hypothetical protein